MYCKLFGKANGIGALASRLAPNPLTSRGATVVMTGQKQGFLTEGIFVVFQHQSHKQEAVVMLLARSVFFHWRDDPRHHAA